VPGVGAVEPAARILGRGRRAPDSGGVRLCWGFIGARIAEERDGVEAYHAERAPGLLARRPARVVTVRAAGRLRPVEDLSCQELVELVTDYLDGALPPRERAR
jgi:hypothetical protein